jgi:hypothetical protein
MGRMRSTPHSSSGSVSKCSTSAIGCNTATELLSSLLLLSIRRHMLGHLTPPRPVPAPLPPLPFTIVVLSGLLVSLILVSKFMQDKVRSQVVSLLCRPFMLKALFSATRIDPSATSCAHGQRDVGFIILMPPLSSRLIVQCTWPVGVEPQKRATPKEWTQFTWILRTSIHRWPVLLAFPRALCRRRETTHTSETRVART